MRGFLCRHCFQHADSKWLVLLARSPHPHPPPVSYGFKHVLWSECEVHWLSISRFYRYVLDPELTFRSDGEMTDGPVARFLDLPHKSLLTLAMEPPESWLVESVSSVYDLDNILLEEVGLHVVVWEGKHVVSLQTTCVGLQVVVWGMQTGCCLHGVTKGSMLSICEQPAGLSGPHQRQIIIILIKRISTAPIYHI